MVVAGYVCMRMHGMIARSCMVWTENVVEVWRLWLGKKCSFSEIVPAEVSGTTQMTEFRQPLTGEHVSEETVRPGLRMSVTSHMLSERVMIKTGTTRSAGE